MAVKLKADKRENNTKSYIRGLREEGVIPAIVYGKGKEPVSVAVDSVDLLKTVRDEGKNAVISLDIKGESVDVMLHDYQTDPLKASLVHADFYVVNMSEARTVEVPIQLEGEAPGSNEGGVLQQPLYDLEISAKPNDIPDQITVDVSKLEVGDSISVGDLPTDGAYEILTDADTTIATVTAPTAEIETDDTTTGDADDVEAIEEGSKNDKED
ncbi:50S ribosomal protein L25/general stress protein Ctc [Terribacillus saccharophilus]|uniref:50S ribosomal protein L25/general stress protein Ctc n=1 Tax=Terribacillus saccharophilus TaxID=361277 RepID=UPI000BA6123B|nr:50S ribosomal protein L25/general stress protein Ctc [Terribacillus saccharophilus]PAF16163.1 50S ribosomal protein L25/general stress protein Ctc [Terribacillus saccharophilus]PAF20104.1 50S ribosomal protein L25/general stress protein Ctc [Terribacillus saccharophilus]PAF34568.1 50S ribosomal protein L25/general stress protein Ctc [Terribacillus saccharophilus]PAF35170.1 50S ribosomal protein L25/general stress protein Ctc [Terribacillus saccharophilus]